MPTSAEPLVLAERVPPLGWHTREPFVRDAASQRTKVRKTWLDAAGDVIEWLE